MHTRRNEMLEGQIIDPADAALEAQQHAEWEALDYGDAAFSEMDDFALEPRRKKKSNTMMYIGIALIVGVILILITKNWGTRARRR